MTSLLGRTRRIGLALVIAAGLTILSAVATPLLGNELANVFGPTSAFAGETSGGGG
jgi:hypothetical protein